MIIGGRRASFLLFVGDLAAFAASLYVTLWVRYGTMPGFQTLELYLVPFSLLFALWVLVFYSAGLYGKRLALFPTRLAEALFSTQIANIIFAALFFFLVPAFGITPKTILALYLVISLVFIFLWRLGFYPKLTRSVRRERAVLIADGEEAEELFNEVNGNARYGIEFSARVKDSALIDPAACLTDIERMKPSILVVDTAGKAAERIVPLIYNLTRIERRYQFVDFEDLYEEVFDRIPLSQLEHGWFLENVASANSSFYAAMKRAIDIVGGILMGLVAVGIAPFVFIANHIEGPGPLFIRQERFGQYGAPLIAYKFRSMRLNKAASREWTSEEKKDNPVTKVGSFLRLTSLDEFPQFINILRGEISLVGPRNDILGLGKRLAEELPYYEARYLVRPGITGWAQINQQYEQGNVSPQSVEETKMRLAYDFFYLKHRSLGLDIVIALKTFKRMFFRVSSW